MSADCGKPVCEASEKFGEWLTGPCKRTAGHYGDCLLRWHESQRRLEESNMRRHAAEPLVGADEIQDVEPER